MAYELGWRYEPVSQFSLDLAVFYNQYNDLNDVAMGAPVFVAAPVPHIVVPQITENGMSGETYGGELSAQWRVSDDWKLEGSYSHLHMRLKSQNPTYANDVGDSPQNQFQLHSYFNVTRDVEFNTSLYYVDSLPNQGVNAFVRLDAGVIWRPSRSWEFSIWGQNLVDNRHEEFGSYRYPVLTEVGRNFYAKATWRF